MVRPPSIGRFEQFWWGSTLLWGVGTRLAWDRTQNALARDPRTAPVAEWAQFLHIGVVLAVTLLLWWLVARRASVIGKWLVVAMAAFSGLRALLLVFNLVVGANLHPLSQGCFLIAAGLAIASAALLFRDDARDWFGESYADDDDGEEEPAA